MRLPLHQAVQQCRQIPPETNRPSSCIHLHCQPEEAGLREGDDQPASALAETNQPTPTAIRLTALEAHLADNLCLTPAAHKSPVTDRLPPFRLRYVDQTLTVHLKLPS